MHTKSFPNALVLIVLFVLFSGLLTYVIPKGVYEREINEETGRETVISGSYETIAAPPLPVTRILMAFPEGFKEASELIALILLLGGAFYVIEDTGALTNGIGILTTKMAGKQVLTLVLISLFFAQAGVLNGFQEEVIALTPLLILLGRKMGYNAITMVGVSFGSAIIGGSLGPINPFGVLIAQKVAQVPLMSGAAFRVIFLLITLTVWTAMVIRYGNKNRVAVETTGDETTGMSLSKRHLMVILLIIAAFILMGYGIVFLDWGFNEISAEFFVLAVLSGLIGGLGLNQTALSYTKGFKEMIFACMVVGFARSISIVLKEGMVIDSIIFGLFTPLQYLPTTVSAIGMMISQALLHLPIPSYSAQAALTLPILAPLSDLLGLSRQVCILAFQFGAQLMDVVVPTNGALMGVLAVAGIPFNHWWAFIWKRMILILVMCAMALAVAVFIGV